MFTKTRNFAVARITLVISLIGGFLGMIPVTVSASERHESPASHTNNSVRREFMAPVLDSAGSLDVTFDGDGLATTSLGNNAEGAETVVIQPDGKIVVAGTFANTTSLDFLLVRYNSDGSLDVNFGVGGIVTVDFGETDSAYGVALQDDGKIVVAGSSNPPSGDTKFALARINPDGALDSTFDTDGKVVTDLGVGYDYLSNVAIQGDGKIVAIGSKNVGTNNDDIALARYNSDGSLDTTFDSDGIAITPIGSGSDFPFSIAFQPDGKIIVGGGAEIAPDFDFVLVRYNNNGSLDTSFDNDGVVITDVTNTGGRGHAALQPDGNILIAGSGGSGSVIARYDEFGSLDPNFGMNGIVASSLGGSSFAVQNIALQQNEKIVLAGYVGPSASGYDFALARYNSDGSPDTIQVNRSCLTESPAV